MSTFKITFIIPLLGREFHTHIWLKENLRDDCYYIFADGSHDNKNFEIFKNLQSKNIKYVRYDKDENYSDYIKKMSDVSLHVNTKYVMTSDNDDFLNYKGIFKCINFLENNNTYDFASGSTLFVKQNGSNEVKKLKYKIVFQSAIGRNLDNLRGIKAIEKYLDSNVENTGYVWYSIYRSETFKKVWNSMHESDIHNGKLNEYLQTCMSFCYGKYKYINCNHYIRLVNPQGSFSKQDKEILNVSLVFDEKIKNQLNKFIDYLTKKLGLDHKIVLNAFKKMIPPSKRTKFYSNNVFKNFCIKASIFIVSRIINLKFYLLRNITSIFNFYFFIKNK